MRPALVAGLAILMLPAFGLAQSGSYYAVVGDPEVPLRAGPSDRFPETGTVKQGVRVVVDHAESNGWLAIVAPAGSVSWVPQQFIEGFDKDRPLPQNVM